MRKSGFERFVGTGGIGTGILFNLDSNRMLGRNETRLADLSKSKDYCKQHIILHYIARVLSDQAKIYPIGKVGADDAGNALLNQMQMVGMDTRFVMQIAERPTMYCVCIQYPDKAVCNVTTSESACALVDRQSIDCALNQLCIDERTLVLAVPEVPVEARIELLHRGKQGGAYCVSSCLVDEFSEFMAQGGMRYTDLLIINEDEAVACCGEKIEDMHDLAMTCYRRISAENPDIRLVMTCGQQGSWVCEGNRIAHIPIVDTEVAATGGAGDAYTAGTICGLALGLPFFPEKDVKSAPMLGAVFAGIAINDVDTISMRIDRETVDNYLGDSTEKKN